MINEFYFKPIKLRDTLEKHIDKDHMLIKEHSLLDMQKDVETFLQRVKLAKGKQLQRFAASLSNSELVFVLYAMKSNISGSLKRKLLYILKKRMKKKLFLYGWNILQEDYSNQNLMDAMELICSYMEIRYREEFENSLFYKVRNYKSNLLDETLNVLLEEGIDLQEFFVKYNIRGSSQFGQDLLFKYFSTCKGSGFWNNKDIFIEILGRYRDEKIVPVVQNYLENLGVNDFIEDVNLLILHEYGEPNQSSSFWRGIDDGLKVKFCCWNSIKKLEEYLGSDNKLLNLFKEFYSYIRSIYIDRKKNMIVVEFEKHTAVCLGNRQHEFYLCTKSLFNKKDGRYLDPKVLAKNAQPIISARYAVLEGIKSDIYKSNTEGVGVLYIKEILKREIVQQ